MGLFDANGPGLFASPMVKKPVIQGKKSAPDVSQFFSPASLNTPRFNTARSTPTTSSGPSLPDMAVGALVNLPGRIATAIAPSVGVNSTYIASETPSEGLFGNLLKGAAQAPLTTAARVGVSAEQALPTVSGIPKSLFPLPLNSDNKYQPQGAAQYAFGNQPVGNISDYGKENLQAIGVPDKAASKLALPAGIFSAALDLVNPFEGGAERHLGKLVMDGKEVEVIKGIPTVAGKKGYGFAKIVSDHPEVVPHIEEAFNKAKVVETTADGTRVILEAPPTAERLGVRFVVDHQLGDQPKTFLNNAYFLDRPKSVLREGFEPPTSPVSGERSTTELSKPVENLSKAPYPVKGIEVGTTPADLERAAKLEEAKVHLSILKDTMADHPGKGLGNITNWRNGEFVRGGDTKYQNRIGQEASDGGDLNMLEQHREEYAHLQEQYHEAQATVKQLSAESKPARFGSTGAPVREPVIRKTALAQSRRLGSGLQAAESPSRLPKASSYSRDIGNIANHELNVEHLNISPESKALVAHTVEEVKPLIEKAIGDKLSNQEALYLADRSSKVLTRAVGRETTLEWQAAMLKARQALSAASESGTVDENYIRNLLTIKTQGTDIARKLQSLSIGADAVEPTAKQAIIEAVMKTNASVEEILKAAEGVDFHDLKQATNFYRQFVKPTVNEWLDLLRYNSMLSSPKTHIVNTFSNLVNTTLMAPLEKTITGGLDWLGSSLTGRSRSAFAGEGGVYLANYLKSTREGVRRFADVLKGNRTYSNLDTRNIPIATKGLKGTAVTALSYPTRLLEAMDQLFSGMAEGGARGQFAYRARKGGSVGNIDTMAQQDAAYRLYREKPLNEKQGHLLNAIDTFTTMIQGLRQSDNPIVSNVAKFTVPFIQTPMNIFKQGIENSPAGFATLVGAKNKTEQLSKAIIGSSIFASAALLLSSNRLTWGEPVNATQKADFRDAGMQPYSVKIGNKWYSYQKLPPQIAFPLALVAGIHDAVAQKKIDDNNVDLVLSAVSKYGQFLADQSYAKSIGDVLAAAQGGESGIEKIASNYVQQFIPFRALGGWMAHLTDGIQRKPDSAAPFIDQQVQYLMTQVPGLSEQAPARLNNQGEPIPNTDKEINAFSPVNVISQSPEKAQKYQTLLQFKKDQKDEAAQKAKDKASIQPVYDQAQQLIGEGKQAEADTLVQKLSDKDYELYKSVKASVHAKNTTRMRTLLGTDPPGAVQFVRGQPRQEQDRLIKLMTDEEYATYQTGKDNQ